MTGGRSALAGWGVFTVNAALTTYPSGALGNIGAQLMVEERTAEGSHEEVVEEDVLAGQLVFGPVPGVVPAHDQPTLVTPGNELVGFSAVDLQLVQVKPLDQVAGQRLGCAEGCRVVGFEPPGERRGSRGPTGWQKAKGV